MRAQRPQAYAHGCTFMFITPSIAVIIYRLGRKIALIPQWQQLFESRCIRIAIQISTQI